MRLLLAALLLAALPVQAHHSTATNFTQEIIEISGTIEQIRFQNPHTSFVVKTEAAPGQAPYWLVESDARSTFQRKGVDLGAVAAGSQVKVSGRKGVRANTLFLRDMALEDGTVFTSSGTGRD